MKRKNFIVYLLIFMIWMSIFLPVSFSFASVDDVYVDAPVALLMESNSGKILYEKNAKEKRFPASTTKIMTAILALENRDLSDTATVSEYAVSSIPYSYTIANLQIGEVLTYEQLLYVLLVPSANDAATVIAEDIGGSVEEFSNMMNQKAKEIGCENTHFVNANGIHQEDHYSTAYDLALMGRYAMKNDIFRKFVITSKYTLPTTNWYNKEDRIFTTTNRLVNANSSQYYEFATGIKTGYTDPAGNCIVASAKKNDMELICVVLGAGSDVTTTTNKFDDCISLFNYGFREYKYETLCSANDVFKVISPKNASKDTLDLPVLYENDIHAFVNTEKFASGFNPKVELNENISAPISKGSVIGKISYTIDDINYTTNLIAGQDISLNSFFPIIFKIILVIFALYIFKCLINLINGGKWKRKKGKHSRHSKKKKKNSNSSLYHFDY